MNEDFLQYLWKYQLLDRENLKTTKGETVEVIKPGIQNTDAGPDFLDARIKIGKTIWAGSVEIHIKASDWIKHKHHDNPGYNNVILHVVHENDEEVARENKENLPALVLKPNEKMYKNYLYLKENEFWVGCQQKISEIDSFEIEMWMERLAVERLVEKSFSFLQILENNKNHWAEAFFYRLIASFGLKTNALPFEILAKSIPFSAYLKHRDSLLQLEALFFGQAGFLQDTPADDYNALLQREYNLLKVKFHLKPLEKHIWKFHRIRPMNFPTIRLSQLANLLYRDPTLHSKILQSEKLNEIYKLFETSVTQYWKNHTNFGKKAKLKTDRLGEQTIKLLVINLLIPYLFAFGIIKNDDKFKEKALNLLMTVSPENNKITRKWESIGMKNENAMHSQSLLQLKNKYCNLKKCLDCGIGNNLVRKI